MARGVGSEGWDGKALVSALLDPACFEHPVEELRLLETHISYVILTGPYAYKIKKPLDLGFLDFTDLAKRHFYCGEEVRLNRRLAPELYLGVVPVTEDGGRPKMNGSGPVLEYAVKMREFPQEALLDQVLAREGLTGEQIDTLAKRIAAFHRKAAVAPPATSYGSPECVEAPVRQNFDQMLSLVAAGRESERLMRLKQWSEQEGSRLKPLFQARKRDGAVRECHGDLHLANMAFIGGEVVVFDCIEFNPELRWIDVMSEAAFLAMDLRYRGRLDLSRRFLNTYLEESGDYEGVGVLRYYLVYRSLVRAKIACIRAFQPGAPGEEKARELDAFAAYLALAEEFARPRPLLLAVTHGLSGSGKSRFTGRLLLELDAIRVRSDVERKRLYGLAPEARSHSGLGTGLYAEEVTRQTYQRLEKLARACLSAGWQVVVDAAFLKGWQRRIFARLAREFRAPFVILAFQAPEAVLRERLAERQKKGANASEAGERVLEQQLKAIEPLQADEAPHTLGIDTSQDPDPLAVKACLDSLSSQTVCPGR